MSWNNTQKLRQKISFLIHSNMNQAILLMYIQPGTLWSSLFAEQHKHCIVVFISLTGEFIIATE